MFLGEGEGRAGFSRDRECKRDRSRRVSIFLRWLPPLAQCYFKGRSGSHNRINEALPAKDRHPNRLIFPWCVAPERDRLFQINDEMRLPAPDCNVLRLMFQQVPQKSWKWI